MTDAAEHAAVRDLLPSVALAVASPEETFRVERHAARCPVCREEIDALRATGAALALAVPQVEPPASLRRAVMAAVREDVRRHAPARRVPRLGRLRPWPATVGALAAAVVALAAWNATLQTGSSPTGVAVAQVGPGVSAGGLVVDVAGTRAVVLRVRGLATLAPGHGYEVWAIRDGRPRSAGFMQRRADGSHVALVDLDGVSRFAITAEPLTNTAGPTGAMLAVFDT